RRHAPGVMGLIVDYDDILGGGHLFQHIAHVSLVAFLPTFVHTVLFENLLLALPVQFVPVPDERAAGLALPYLVFKARRDDLKFGVVVSWAPGNQNLQSVLHSKSWRN